MTNVRLDVGYCRSQFAPLVNGWIYFENAGGSYVPEAVVDQMQRFMRECQCQPGYGFAGAREANRRLQRAVAGLAELINADEDEVVIGPSTTLNVQVLARALADTWSPGDEVVVPDLTWIASAAPSTSSTSFTPSRISKARGHLRDSSVPVRRVAITTAQKTGSASSLATAPDVPKASAAPSVTKLPVTCAVNRPCSARKPAVST